ncbi:DNA-binding protein IolR [Candidatus Vecturithrix granuli]|uniref:DNA-binding protein IolR n=1 Tax=Vecturithrix granuli TaxID=1499967 RepID=A0A081C0L0_VECG1|nr:DNA-binding protein IolR [Candidatus Vecturithrix granuli]
MKVHRIQQIEEYIKSRGVASLDELCRQFDVSKNTIRRDVQELESRQIVKKVYGGVMMNEEKLLIPSISQRQVRMPGEKALIGQKAAEFVNDGDVVIIDSGTTTVHIIEHLQRKQNITVITNSIPALNAAALYQQLHVIVTGGDLLHSTNSLVGPEAIAMLKKLNANRLFLAVPGISLTKGITTHSRIEAEIKKMMMEVSEQIILLADHTKFDAVSLVTFAELHDIDIVITDQSPPLPYNHYCTEHNVSIVVAVPENQTTFVES